MDPNKPDFCAITHFAGYFPNLNPLGTSDGGTSAATPIAAGVIALYKQKKLDLTQDSIKNALKKTAKDIGPTGWDKHSGSGIIRAKAAYDELFGICFIATAAYGSELEPNVQFLREFRDSVVLKSKYNNMFEELLDIYYRFSPPIAHRMKQNEVFKQFMKYLLVKPIVTLLKVFVRVVGSKL